MEVHLFACFAFLLNSRSEIEDFKLRSNVEDFGNLDDLLVDIETKSGENLYFVFRLNHNEKSDEKLSPADFEEKGDFNLEKYCEAFKKLSEEYRKYHFILYTNKNFDSSRTSEVENFCMKTTQDVCCFDTSGDGNNLYKFEVRQETEDGKNVNKDDYEEFFLQFSLYTGQANIRDLEKFILDILKHKECYDKYIDFFRKWHKGDFNNTVLDKKTLNVHLVDIFLSPFAINYYLSDGQDENTIFFEEIVQQFDIAIIDASKQDFIKHLEDNIYKYPEEFNKENEENMIRLAKDNKLIDRFSKELTEETKLKLLHYFYQKPLILDFNDSSKNLIYEASKLCKIQENEIKLVILGQNFDQTKFSHLKIFTNLSEVDGYLLEEIKRRCNLSLQGRNISFEVTPREIFQMLKGSFSIGEDKEKLPECYIPRSVSATVFDIETIIKNFSGSDTIIFYYENRFEELKISIENIMDREDYFYEDFLDGIILRNEDTFPKIPAIILNEDCSKIQFDEICEELRIEEHSKKEIAEETYSNESAEDTCEESEEKDVHLFKVLDEKRCLLLMSTSTKISVEENSIHVFFNNSINILCAQSGMGKSTLMKHLKNECDPNVWTVMVNLKAHNQFLKTDCKIEDVLTYFMELENCQDIFPSKIKEMFLEKRKVVFFLDGLDEIEDKCVDSVLNITRELSEMGFRIWLSSRQNLKQKIENYFNSVAIEIDAINENQQKEYIEERLKSQYNEDEIEEIVEKILNNTVLANNCQILEIPLQLHIITQIFLDDKSYYSNLRENNFILTKMLEVFFKGKYKHFITKIQAENLHILRTLEEKFENYELVALHSVLDDKHFQKLKIENFKLSQLKNWDFRLGIITEVNSENKAVFEHLTFAEYFAAKFLVKNFDKARILKEEIFTEKYQNLLLIFNIMLAEDNPLHLAIIYKDLSRIQEMEESSLVDKGGRNFLQIIACAATRHPHLESCLVSSECLVIDDPVKHFKGEDSKIEEIVNLALSTDDEPFKNDEIFKWNSLDYALVNGALYIVEAILEKYEKPSNFYEILGKYYSDEVVIYYSIRFGYHILLSEILAKNSYHVTNIVSNNNWGYDNMSILNFLFLTSNRKNRTRIVELLTGDDINKTVYDKDGYTFLHFAVLHGDIEFVKFLLAKKAKVNIENKYGLSPLHLAVVQSNLDISKLLVENRAGVNIKDIDGWSPLHWAANENNVEISRFLVDNKADVNIKDEKGKTPLFLAVEQGNLNISKFLVDKGADVNIEDKKGNTPLSLAAKRRNVEISKLLVENGADVNIQDKDDLSSLLLLAVEQSNLDTLKLLVENGANVKTKDEKGKSLLFLAVEQNNLEISRLLVENGADVNIKDKKGIPPLVLAVELNNLKVSKLLIEKGADVNCKNEYAKSLLLLAFELNNFDILKFLVENGANVNTKDEKGKSLLFLAVEQNNLEITKFLVENGADVSSTLFWAIELNNFEILKFLVENKANINIKDKDGWSPLHWACNVDNFEISHLLVEKGANVNIEDKDGWTPLFWAAYRKNFKISQLLIENGANVNIQDIDRWSPLRLAVERSNLEISKLLVEKGANINIIDKNGFTPLFWAVKRNNCEIIKFLVENGANGGSALFWAVDLNNRELIKLLIRNEADLNIKDKEGKSPLLLAVQQNYLEILKLLVENKADGSSALFWAVSRNYNEIIKLLVENGTDVNIKDKEGKSPLFWAVERRNFEISKLLVENGADVNIKDNFGCSPLLLAVNQNNREIIKLFVENGANGSSVLFWAVNQNNLEIIKLLIKNGTDVNIEDKKGKSPLSLAVELNNGEIIKLLVESGANGSSALFWALNRNDNEIIKLLVENGTNVNIKDKEGDSPLLLTVKLGNLNNFEISKFLVEKEADVNIQDKNGSSPLHLAVERNYLEISRLLVENKANVNIKDKKGKTPLFLAVEQSNVEILMLLVENGAEVNIQDKDDWSPLFWAVERNNLQISKLLVEKRANVNIHDKDGCSPLDLAVVRDNREIIKLLVENGANGSSALFWAVNRNDYEIIKLLVKNGTDVKIKDKEGKSPLFYAVKQKNLAILKLLLENRADVKFKDKDGWSLLRLAVELSDLEISKFLIDKEADVNIKDEKGKTLLFLAIERRNLEISKLLVENRTDVNIKDKDGCSPLSLAVDRNMYEIIKLLVENGANGSSALSWAVNRNDFEISKRLIENGTDVKDKEGNKSLLSVAVELNNREIIKLLVENGANESSAMFWAVNRNEVRILKLLVGNGANVNIQDKDGWAPLHEATKLNYFEISKFLLENGANVNVEDKDRWSPLHEATKLNNFKILKLLIENEANVNIKDRDGCSLLHLAFDRDNCEIVKLLVENGADRNSALFLAVNRNNFEISKMLIKNGTDVNIEDKKGKSPLFYAVKLHKNREISKLLYKSGARVNSEIRDAFYSLVPSEE